MDELLGRVHPEAAWWWVGLMEVEEVEVEVEVVVVVVVVVVKEK